MVIGAVTLSLTLALLGSFYGTAAIGLELWQSFALYVSLGFLTLSTLLMATFLSEIREDF